MKHFISDKFKIKKNGLTNTWNLVEILGCKFYKRFVTNAMDILYLDFIST